MIAVLVICGLLILILLGMALRSMRSPETPYIPPSSVPRLPKPSSLTPHLSCFVRGVMRSMEVKADEWTYTGKQWSGVVSRRGDHYSDPYWTHTSGIEVRAGHKRSYTDRGCPYDGDRIAYLTGSGYTLSDAESAALLIAYDRYLEGPRIAAIQAEAARAQALRDAQLAAIRAPFEQMGCSDIDAKRP